MPDHVHIFIGYNVNQLIPSLVEEIKTSSIAWIKGKKISEFKFDWQKGYGAFTCSRAQIDIEVKYVLSQREHHQRKAFREEYLELLEKNDIRFANEYLFDFFNDIN